MGYQDWQYGIDTKIIILLKLLSILLRDPPVNSE